MKLENFDSHDHHPFPAVSDHCGLSIDIQVDFAQKPSYSINRQDSFFLMKEDRTPNRSEEEDGGNTATSSFSLAGSLSAFFKKEK
jgi:hypothetical protein